MDVELVIARYKENIDWIKNINSNIKIKIYNKFYNEDNYLPNIGREGHTYLTHIIDNYDKLSDFIIFTQADPFAHYSDFINDVNKFYSSMPESSDNYLKFLCHPATESIYGNHHKCHKNGLPMYYFFDLLFNKKLEPNTKFKIYYGAQFITHKNNILSKPKEFYIFLRKFLSYEIDPIEGYIIERLWLYILDPVAIISDKYKLFLDK